jgi:hypothetical protein
VYVVSGGFAGIYQEDPKMIIGDYRRMDDYGEGEAQMVKAAHRLFLEETRPRIGAQTPEVIGPKLRIDPKELAGKDLRCQSQPTGWF